jgi:hypothetical protein
MYLAATRMALHFDTNLQIIGWKLALRNFCMSIIQFEGPEGSFEVCDDNVQVIVQLGRGFVREAFNTLRKRALVTLVCGGSVNWVTLIEHPQPMCTLYWDAG